MAVPAVHTGVDCGHPLHQTITDWLTKSDAATTSQARGVEMRALLTGFLRPPRRTRMR